MIHATNAYQRIKKEIQAAPDLTQVQRDGLCAVVLTCLTEELMWQMDVDHKEKMRMFEIKNTK